MRKVFNSAILSIILILSTLTGCRSADTAEAAAPAPEPTVTPTPRIPVPSYSGTLNLSMRQPKTLNPLLNEDVTVDSILKLIFEPLAILDANQKPVTNMAASIDFASDGMSVTITLLDTIQWSDGEPITSADIDFSIKTIRQASEASVYKNVVANITECKVINKKTVKISYSQSYSGNAYLLCFPLIPEHYYKNSGAAKDMKPLGNGVYTFDSYTNMKSMTLTASENSFKKKPYLEKVEVLIIPDAQTELYAFDQAIIDVVSAPLANWGKYRGAKQTKTTEYVTSYFDFIGFNHNNPLFQDIIMREAVARCINIQEIIESIYLNHAVRAFSPFSPAGWLYEPPAVVYNYDMSRARELVTALELPGGDEAQAIRILVNEENSERAKIASLLSKGMKTAGLKTEIISVPFEQYGIMLAKGEFDIFIGAFDLSVIPDLTFAFHSIKINGGQNYFSYKNNTMDALLTSFSTAAGEKNQKKAAADLQQFFASELPCVSIAFRKSSVLMDERVYGTVKPLVNNIYANIHEWFIFE